MTPEGQRDRLVLERIAWKAMQERGLSPGFSAAALAELETLTAPAQPAPEEQASVRDLRGSLWCSIDNDDSLDLDQLTVAESLPDGRALLRVAIADVDALVKKAGAIDERAAHNTTSVYTAAQIFPMLPEKLSTGLTSLNFEQDRLVVVFEAIVSEDGSVEDSGVSRALVSSRAKLAYNSVAAWLDGTEEQPAGIAAVPGLADTLRLQDRMAQAMQTYRHARGALSLETIEAKPVFQGDLMAGIEVEVRNRAKGIVEDFMIATNGVAARFLEAKGYPSMRRVVRTPKRWDRIAEIAAEQGFRLPGVPDPMALEGFLTKARAKDPLRFPDLSLAVIKLLGAGEYVAEMPGRPTEGHFGLAVKDYGHSTAPNRRFTDLITQRLLKAALAGQPAPYGLDELSALASHCTKQEDAANKVERQVGKSAAALFLRSRIGEQFDGMVTGAADKGTWARLLQLPVEGRVVAGFKGLDVGDRVRLQLAGVDVERGFIDFTRVGK